MVARFSRILPFAAAIAPVPAAAQSGPENSQPVIIVTAPGGSFDLDDAATLNRSQIAQGGMADTLAALTRNIAGVTLQDAQNNPWQPNLVFRGYIASPLQGQAQGLAVYLDGARFNQPFGDTVNFDLVPDAALRFITLFDANPTYGLNALGGSLALETATGASDPGAELTVSLGSYGERDASISAGGTAGAVSAFGALQYRKENGWRDYSPSELYNGYADFGYDGERAGLHLKLIGADTDLTGNGVAPVELLAARRQAVFSWPDNMRARYGRISLHPWLQLGSGTRFEATIYRQRLTSYSLNGDVADFETCEDAPGFVCLEDAGVHDEDDGGEEAILTDASGQPIADVLGGDGYGVLNSGSVRTRSHGVLAQLINERPLFGGVNRLTLGVSHDSSHTDFATSTELGALTEARSVNGLGALIVQEDGAIAPVGLVAKTRYLGLFIAEDLPLTSDLSAEIALRYNRAHIRLEDQIGTALNGDHHFRRLNPSVELDWQAGEGIALRAGYAETNRAPTPAELSCADENAPCSLTNFFVADPPLRQVVAKSWKLGASGLAAANGWSLRWQVTAYRSTNRDDIQYIASAIRGRAYFQNVGATRRQGAELSLEASRGDFRLHAGYAYIDASHRSPFALTSPSNPKADEDGIIQVTAGDRLPGIPRHSVLVGAEYDGLLGSRKFSLGGDILIRSNQVLIGDDAGLTPPVPGYAIVNLRGSVELVAGVSIFVELRNAFDRKYATFGTFSEVDEIDIVEVPDASDPRAYGPGSPRRWSLGLRTRL